MPLRVLAEMTSPYLEHRVANDALVRLMALFKWGCCCCNGNTFDIEMVFVGSKLKIWLMGGTSKSVVTQFRDLGSTSSATNGMFELPWA